MIAKMDFLIPAQRLRETGALLAFHHPKPSHRVHILIVPRRAYHSLMDVAPEDHEFQRAYAALLSDPRYQLAIETGTSQEANVQTRLQLARDAFANLK